MSAKQLEALQTTLSGGIVLLVIAWVADLHGRLQIALFTEQLLASVLGCGLALCFLRFPLAATAGGERAIAQTELQSGAADRGRVGWIDLALAGSSLLSCFYIAARYPELIKELAYRPWDGVLISSAIVLLVCEATRRVAGLALVVIVLALGAYAMLGWLLPEPFTSRPVALSRLLVYLGIDTNALLGNTLQIAIVVVTPFIIMGQVLTRCGGSDYFAELAGGLMGGFRGGSAKVAVVGSALFGMISGSAVANVASVGTITIPLMKRAGFAPHIAAAVEAVGSTGGQVMPPVMGAAAFLMAEYLQVPYAEVMAAALIPAFLYYAALFIQVDLEAARLGIRGTPRGSAPALGAVLRGGWHFPIPFAVLVSGLLWWNLEAEVAALLATAALIALAMIVPYKGRRLKPSAAFFAVLSTGRAVVDIIVITAIAGILIGALSLTGVVFSMTQQLLAMSGGNLGPLLVITALAAFVLGLPLPTVGVYVVLASLAAPALVQAGVSPMQAHLFVLFNGILGMVTPPVALAAFAAATIAGADQWKTGWAATRMSWCAYLLPFMFVYSPELIMRGSPAAILAALAIALAGVFLGTVAVVGYLTTRVPLGSRVACALAAGMLLVQPGMVEGVFWIHAVGVAAAAAVIAREVARGRTHPQLAPG